jgi:hypothetical protein
MPRMPQNIRVFTKNLKEMTDNKVFPSNFNPQ